MSTTCTHDAFSMLDFYDEKQILSDKIVSNRILGFLHFVVRQGFAFLFGAWTIRDDTQVGKSLSPGLGFPGIDTKYYKTPVLGENKV